MLSEARKYRLNLTLAHQYLGQLSDRVRDSVFGNVGSLISFRLGGADANVIAEEFDGTYAGKQFVELGNHEIMVKQLVEGRSCVPFLAKTLEPLGTDYGQRENIIRRSREKYATRREVAEDRIRRWLER